MKMLALDLGDVWIGSAISDFLGITCRPHETVKRHDLEPFLKKTLQEHRITSVVLGYPKTCSGGESEQTKKILEEKTLLEQQFPTITWILWDERLSSKRADLVKSDKRKEKQKYTNHAIAAAFILQSYLDYKAIHRSGTDEE